MLYKRTLRELSVLCVLLIAGPQFAHCGNQEIQNRSTDIERWFIPGELGHESGRSSNVVSPYAYLTKSMAGVDRWDKGVWSKLNGLGHRLEFTHNLSRIFPPSLAASHPEYFPEENGRRIVPPPGSSFWNPDLGRLDVAKHTALAAKKHFSQHPDQVSFAVGINDGLIYGDSPETLKWVYPPKWFRQRPNYSDYVYQFTNRVADKIAVSYPGKYIGSLAYYWCEQVPTFPVRRNVIPFLTADRSQGYDLEFLREDRDLQARWAKAGPERLGLYDYIYGSGFLIPRYHPHLLAENLRVARRLGFTDYFAEVFPNWGLDGPQPWLVAQLLSNPETPVDGLLDEFFKRYFREAAVPMRRFYDLCENQWLKQPGRAYWLKHFRNESQASLFPPVVCHELRKHLQESAKLATTPRVRERIKLVSETFGVTERFVAFQNARESLTRKALGRELTGLSGLNELVNYRRLRSSLISYLIWLRYHEPLALYPSDFRDFFLNDPLFDATISLMLATAERRPRELATISAQLNQINAGPVQAALRSMQSNAGMSFSPEVTFEGQLQPERRIAGLTYGISLPLGWQSRVEPAEHHAAEWTTIEGSRMLHLRGTKDTAIYKWVRAAPGKIQQATVEMKGQLSPSAIATITLGWLDSQHKHLGYILMRMPDGKWDKWCELNQGAMAPPGAAWVGVGIRVQHLEAEDWVEIKSLGLKIEASRF